MNGASNIIKIVDRKGEVFTMVKKTIKFIRYLFFGISENETTDN